MMHGRSLVLAGSSLLLLTLTSGPARTQTPVPPREFPPAEATAHQRGRLTLTFTERSPFSVREDVLARTGVPEKEIAENDPKGARYDLGKESFAVYVPDSYKPEERWGLFVWVSPTESGRTPSAEIEELLARRRLLWVGPNQSGNGRPRWYRYSLALDAAHNMKKLYNLDERRIYVGGYSGGGRISSVLAVVYPEVFEGGFYLFGCDYFKPLPMRDRPGAHYVPLYPKPPRAAFKLVRERNRYVFLTGDTDSNKLQTQDTAQAYRKDDFAHVTYIEVPNRGHMGPMEPSWFGEGLAKLDEGVPGAPEGT